MKKHMVLLAAMCMVFVLVACGKQEPEELNISNIALYDAETGETVTLAVSAEELEERYGGYGSEWDADCAEGDNWGEDYFGGPLEMYRVTNRYMEITTDGDERWRVNNFTYGMSKEEVLASFPEISEDEKTGYTMYSAWYNAAGEQVEGANTVCVSVLYDGEEYAGLRIKGPPIRQDW